MQMRKFILGASVALAAAAGPSAAQDFATQPPAPVVPATGPGPVAAPPAVLPAGPVGPAAPVVPYGGDPYLSGGDFFGDAGPPYRFYTEGSFLLWFLDDININTPLVTTGPSLGILGLPGTAVLPGPQSVNYGAATGFKVAVGRWLGDSRLGVEASGFYVGPETDRTDIIVNDNLVLARPFFDTTSQRENARIVAAPGAFSGGITIDNWAQVWGFEVNPFWRIITGGRVVVDMITGFRYLQYQEALNIFDGSTVLAGGVTAFNGFGLGAGSQLVVHDRFGATNSFYGGNIGARMSSAWGGWFWDMTGKVAIGGVNQVVNVDGTTTLVAGGPFVTAATSPGGFLASGNYLGRRSENRFAVLPEGDVKLGYQFTSWMNAFVGYSVLYLSSVARPQDQINRNIAVSQLPTSPTFTRNGTFPRGTDRVADDGLWIHGFSFGVTLTY
jgi:hypothetical protein